MLFSLLRPRLSVYRLNETPIAELQGRGIRGIIVDLDNTVTEWNGHLFSPEVAGWFLRLEKVGIAAIIMSNNGGQRVENIARQLGVPWIGNAGKPRGRAFRQAMDMLGCEPGQTAVIGDQMFTDVLGGNRLGLFTVLVTPLSSREFIGTRLVRSLERMIFFFERGRGGA